MLKPWVVPLCALLFFLPLISARAEPQHQDLISPRLVLNLPSRMLALYSESKLVKRYPVAIGKPSTPTPTGMFSIAYKEVNPAWYPPDEPGRVIPSGPYNPLGYRWLGFLPTYGVHGTDNPDSIGQAVSNGCVRMFEPDVEELYRIVDVNTPLEIIYERLQVGLDQENRAYIAILPDVYHCQDITAADVRKMLQPRGWNELIDDTAIQRLLETSDGNEFILMQYGNLIINGKPVVEKTQKTPDGLQIPMQAITDTLKVRFDWLEPTSEIRIGTRQFPGTKRGQVIYAVPESIPYLFGGRFLYSAGNTLEAEILLLTLNGKPVEGDFPRWGQPPLLPVLTLAVAIGTKVSWNEPQRQLTIGETQVPVSVIDGRPYLPINKVFEYFGAYVYWDESARVIDLTYPFPSPDTK